MVCFAVTGGAL